MKILIIGATSAIAKATARIYAEQGQELFLVARNEERLLELADDLKVRGASSAEYRVFDLANTSQHQQILDQAFDVLNHLDLTLICHGSLPNQEACETNFELAQQEINLNGLSVISMLTIIASKLKTQGSGTIATLTSVAGDRGRQPNFVYGAAKSMVSTYLQGLRGKLLPFNIHVIDIRPGLVDSPMTAQFEKGALWSTPELVAREIVKAIAKKQHTVYTPGYWRIIMAVVCAIPEILFKRLKI
jgi:decaprenylphospho-beta-D-erythro-pentofuranosid-2-ulose 2-reductase